jgi:hypothetical protein
MNEIRVHTFAWTKRGGYDDAEIPESWGVWRKKVLAYAKLALSDFSKAWDAELQLVVRGEERWDPTPEELDKLRAAGARSVAKLAPGLVGVTVPLAWVVCIAELDFVRNVDGEPPMSVGISHP